MITFTAIGLIKFSQTSKKIFVKVAWKCLQKSQNRVQLYCEIINKSKFLTLFLKISENMKKVLEKDKGFKHWRKASNG